MKQITLDGLKGSGPVFDDMIPDFDLNMNRSHLPTVLFLEVHSSHNCTYYTSTIGNARQQLFPRHKDRLLNVE